MNTEVAKRKKKAAATKLVVLSPDGFNIHHSDTYKTVAQAEAAFEKWKENFNFQGFYSSVQYGRIPLEDLRLYCKIVAEDAIFDDL